MTFFLITIIDDHNNKIKSSHDKKSSGSAIDHISQPPCKPKTCERNNQ